MDLSLIHMAMELSAAACLFFISWLNIQYTISGKYSLIVAIGMAIAGFADTLHALSTTIFPELLAYWVPLSWGTTRLIVLMTFTTVFLCHETLNCCKSKITSILFAPLAVALIAGILHTNQIISLDWVYQSFNLLGLTVYRPFDFALMIGWAGIAFCLRHKSHILFPPNLYWIFMIQGVMVHALMAFGSQVSLDMSFLLAHGLKISEYYTFILIYLLYKNRLDSLPRINTPSITFEKAGNVNGLYGATKQFRQ